MIILKTNLNTHNVILVACPRCGTTFLHNLEKFKIVCHNCGKVSYKNKLQELNHEK